MVDPRSQSITRKAILFIREIIAVSLRNGEQKLPTINELVRQSGISRMSLWKALKDLSRSGEIRAVHGSGYYLGPVSSATAGKARSLRWEKIRNLIQQDIIGGAISLRAHLGPTDICRRYGVNYRTAVKALTFLEQQGVLGPAIHGSAHLHQIQGDSIEFISEPGALDSSSPAGLRIVRFVQALEHACERLHLHLARQYIDATDPSVVTRFHAAAKSRERHVIGRIVKIFWFDMPHVQQRYTDLLAYLVARKKPVAWIDDYGGFRPDTPAARSRFFRLFTMAAQRAGADCGRFLARLGHRKIVFISPFHGTLWSRDRAAGLIAAWKSLCPNRFLSLCTHEEELFFYVIVCAWFRLSERTIRSWFGTRMPAQHLYDLITRSRRYQKIVPLPSESDASYCREREDLLRSMSAAVKSSRPDMADSVVSIIFKSAWDRIVDLRLGDLFKAARAHHDATAWVCANDGVALSALSFLKTTASSREPPLSVMGMDNSAEGMIAGLASYDFEMERAVERIIPFLLGIEHGAMRSVEELPGMVIPRESVRSV